MLDLNKQQELAKSMPPQLLQAAAQGQHPMIAPHIAAAVAASRQYAQNAANLGAQAQNAPTETTIAGLMKQMAPVQSQPDATANAMGAARTQQAQQQENMRRMQAQMSRPVMAAQGGIMSATPRQPAGMAALIRQHLANPVKAADGGLMRLSQGTTEEKRRKLVEERARRDREMLRRAASGLPQTFNEQLAVLRDTGTMPIRGAAKVYDETVIRAMRALGLNPAELTPMLTPEGESADSPTPFTERALRQRKVAPQVGRGSGRGDAINPPMALDPDQPAYPTQQERKQPPPPPAPPGPGTRNQPPVPTAAQPTASAATGPGIPSLTAANVGAWETDLRNDYKQIGTNAPNVEAYREHEARKQAAERALFEAQQGGSEFSKVFGALAKAGVLESRDSSAAAKGLLGLQNLKEQQRVARPEFELRMTEQDIKEAQRLMEMERGYKDKAVGDRAGVSRPMAEQEARDAEAMRRELSRQEDAARAAGVAFDREQAMEEIKHKYRMREQAARPSGVGGVEGDPKLVAAAERAFAADPRAKSIQKLLGTVVVSHQPDKVRQLNEELATIRAEKYRAAYRAAGLTPPVGAVDTGTGDADPGKVDTSNPLLR